MNNPLALIIEDDEDLAEIFGQALVAAGYSTEIIRDGLAAQTRIKRYIPCSYYSGYAYPSSLW